MKEKRILCIEVNGECRHFTDVNTPLLADAFECQQGLYCTKNTAWKPITKDACNSCKHAEYKGHYTREILKENKKLAEEVYNLGNELKEARLNLFLLGRRGKNERKTEI